VLGYRLPVPEAFLLEWEDRESEDKDLLEYNGALLADRYGIRFDWVMFHAASPQGRAKAVAYNEEMIPAIVKKFGSDVTDKTWKEACNASPHHPGQVPGGPPGGCPGRARTFNPARNPTQPTGPARHPGI
jgi:hypothetical protein